ncbi:hypothetical protein Nepgr_024604 [Nepenthes gracilis]|uniref:Uncharacterized protein n=1 Tax=Nepenthes gracilis TaxID=150966 RepID=A0AAD3T692_NEPGR|nr:hypothetical protein Nepgr_024604 [Nepenthes gracilis]
MNSSFIVFLFLMLEAVLVCRAGRFNRWEEMGILMPTDKDEPDASEDDQVGTRWAVLVAGSSGYGNYRHQADVCHAYQILKRGG